MCPAGRHGADCSQAFCPQACSGHGTCHGGVCSCNPGYAGADCTRRACPASCGHGACDPKALKCHCADGWTGDTCEERQCPGETPCSGHGICREGSCYCAAGHRGPDCGTPSCPGECSHNGLCLEGKCACFEGFEGDDCGSASSGRDHRCATRCSHICLDGCRNIFDEASTVAGRSCYLTCSRKCFTQCVRAGFEVADRTEPCVSAECRQARALPAADPMRECKSLECIEKRAKEAAAEELAHIKSNAGVSLAASDAVGEAARHSPVRTLLPAVDPAAAVEHGEHGPPLPAHIATPAAGK